MELPRGIYLPLWTFDLGGRIDYVAEAVEENTFPFQNGQPKRSRVNGSYPVQANDIPIPASRKPSAIFLRLVRHFDLEAAKPYDSRYLAGWPAEVYDISLAEASLDARAQTLSRYKDKELESLPSVQLISRSSAKMSVECFRLILLPVWITEIPFNGREHLLLINGQNGRIASDLW